MGSVATVLLPTEVNPIIDYRVERCMKQFMIPKKQLDKLWVIFTSNDREGNHYVTADDFFDKIIRYPRSGLTDSMFRIIDTRSDTSLSFGEFVEVVCTFACFEKLELLKYFFYILGIHKSGLVEKNEVKHFVQMIWNHQYNSNIVEALTYLEQTDDGDGTFNFKEILQLQEKYPSTFYPVYNLQIHIIQNVLGEFFWENHKAHILETKEEKKQKELAALQREQREASAKEEAVNDEVVLQRMGYVRFYLMPWLRDRERQRIAKIAAIEAELDAFKERRKTGDLENEDEEEEEDD